jgi:DNA-binding helix-hairpin-helix protein with protein kinase domain
MAEDTFPVTVTDSENAIYWLSRELGAGAQGTVFTASDGQSAVKLIRASAAGAENLRSRLDRIRSLPLWNLPLSRPKSTLQTQGGYTGYVMELLTDMVPIVELMRPPQPIYEEKAFMHWYNVDTGGLRRRLMVLGRAAEALASLHAMGLVFGDPSPMNILVSADPGSDVVYLIDPDNIGVSRQDKGGTPHDIGTPVAKTIGTRGYAAPEVLRGEADVTTLTDAFGFAEIAFRTLTTIHPFSGDLVNNEAPEVEQQAFEGGYPWVGDAGDPSNATEDGVPIDVVLSRPLRELAQATFGPGRADPLVRPGVREWADRFFAAADITVTHRRDDCRGSYYPIRGGKRERRCPWCNEPGEPFALMRITRFVRSFVEPVYQQEHGGRILGEDQEVAFAVISESGFYVTRRIAFGDNGLDGARAHDPLLEIRYSPQGLHFTPYTETDFWVETSAGDSVPLRIPRQIPWERDGRNVAARIWVHFGAGDRAHRVASFEPR